jgi:hypothetical protein
MGTALIGLASSGGAAVDSCQLSAKSCHARRANPSERLPGAKLICRPYPVGGKLTGVNSRQSRLDRVGITAEGWS